MTRAAVLAPPMSQEAATLLTRTFAPSPAFHMTSIVIDEELHRMELTFQASNGRTAKCRIVLDKSYAAN